MATVRFLFVLAWVIALVGLAPVARAQNVAIDNVTRSSADPETGFEYYVSQADCLSSDAFEFPVRLENLGGVQSFEVWISEGANCKLNDERGGSDASCVRLGSPNGAPEQNSTVDIASSAIAEGIGITSCIEEGSGGQPRSVSIYFLLIRGGDADIGEEDAYVWEQTKVDVTGPAPPTNVEAKESDGAVTLTFDVPTNATDVRGYRFYCDDGTLTAPVGSAAGAGGAGTTTATTSSGGEGGSGGAGGSGGGTLTVATATTAAATTGGATNACGTTGLIAGGTPDPSWTSCGSIEGTAVGEGVATGLENGVAYAIAVVGFDELGNVGTLSEVVCSQPFPVDDFFELYRDQYGGQAGGGLCAVTAVGSRTIGGVVFVTSALSAFALLLRRAARRRKSAS